MTDSNLVFVESLIKFVDDRIVEKIGPDVIYDTVSDVVKDFDFSDHIDARTVEDAVNSYLDYNLDVNDIVKDVIEDKIDDHSVVGEAVHDYFECNPKVLRDFFKSDEGKSVIKDVFADLIKGV